MVGENVDGVGLEVVAEPSCGVNEGQSQFFDFIHDLRGESLLEAFDYPKGSAMELIHGWLSFLAP